MKIEERWVMDKSPVAVVSENSATPNEPKFKIAEVRVSKDEMFDRKRINALQAAQDDKIQ